MQNLTIATIQSTLEWENPDLNLNKFSSKVRKLKNDEDLLILPEMFNTGFTMNARNLSENPGGPTAEWMLQLAADRGSVILGSFIVKDQNKYFNRLHAAFPDNRLEIYDKRHLFRMAEEDKTFHYGSSRTIVRWKGWRILPLVCYDLRFPVWSRNTVTDGIFDYDLLIYVANWPKARVSAWDALLKARAIENLAYCAGVNRVGPDGNGIPYSGHTAVFDPKGDTLYFGSEREEVNLQTLDWEMLHSYRNKFPANLDADDFEIE